MIDRDKAIEYVQSWLNSQNADPLAFDKLVVNEKLTIERDQFYGIYYHSSSAPNIPGLAIVDKITGKLYSTVGSSWYNWIKEYESYKATGQSEIDWSKSEVIERIIEQYSVPERNYASIRIKARHEEREQRMKELLSSLLEEIDRCKLRAGGNPELVLRNKNEFTTDVELRIPYRGEKEKNDKLEFFTMTATNIYCTGYTGNYYDYVGALHELKRFGRVNGIKETGEPWVEFIEYDLAKMSDTWKSRVCIPVEQYKL